MIPPQSSPTKLYLAVIVLCAVITAIGQILAAQWHYLSPPEPPKEIAAAEPPRKLEDIGPVAKADADWQPLKPDVVYQAKSAGVVAALSAGSSRSMGTGVISVGRKKNALHWRTRFNEYDGAVLPVPKGRYWTVHTNSGDPKSIRVQWLPMR